ncbi:unnamed protein product [Linum tenue]|uniref:Uncharacterized protein n=1 Tax=Linum tenue TaxID=586396 RepID=A0AAV0LK06_9ROSI|nr:unnamed protein product [Linum tenue]
MASTLLIAAVLVLDLIAFFLAVAAKQICTTGRVEADVNNNGYCIYESDIATRLRADALVLLLANQLLVMEVTRCLCCGRAMRLCKSRSLAIILFIEEFTGGPSIGAWGMSLQLPEPSKHHP